MGAFEAAGGGQNAFQGGQIGQACGKLLVVASPPMGARWGSNLIVLLFPATLCFCILLCHYGSRWKVGNAFPKPGRNAKGCLCWGALGQRWLGCSQRLLQGAACSPGEQAGSPHIPCSWWEAFFGVRSRAPLVSGAGRLASPACLQFGTGSRERSLAGGGQGSGGKAWPRQFSWANWVLSIPRSL